MAIKRSMRQEDERLGSQIENLLGPGAPEPGQAPRVPPEVGTMDEIYPLADLGAPVQSGPEWWEEPVDVSEEIEIPLPSPEWIAEEGAHRRWDKKLTDRVPGTSPWDEDVRPLFRYDVGALERTGPTRPDIVAYLNERRQQTDPEALEQEDRGEATWPAFMPFSGPPSDLPHKVESGPEAGLILQLRGHPGLVDTIRNEYRKGSEFLLRQSDDRLFAMPPGSAPEGFWTVNPLTLGSYALGGADWTFSQLMPRRHTMRIEHALKVQRDLRSRIQAMGDPPDLAGWKKLNHLRRLYREAELNVEAQSGAAEAQGRAKQALESVAGINNATQAFLRVIPDVIKAIGIMAPGVPEDEEKLGSSIYRAGRSIDNAIKWAAPVDPYAEQTFMTSTLPSAIGSLGAFAIPGGLVTRLTGSAIAGTGASAILGAAMNMSNVYDEATQAGATERDRSHAAFWGAVIGSSEALLPGRIFRRLAKSGGGSVKRSIINATLTAGGEGSIEAAQELGAEWLNNINAREFYDESRGLVDNLGVSAGAGFSAGFWLSFVMSMVGQRARQAAGRRLGIDPSSGENIPVTREDIDGLFADLSKRPSSQFARDMKASGFGPEATRRVLEESDPQTRYNLFQSEARRVANQHLNEEDIRAAFPQAARIDRAGGRSYRVAFDTVAGERSILVELDLPEGEISDEEFASSLIEQSKAAGGLTVEVGGRTIVIGTDMDWWNRLSRDERDALRASRGYTGLWSLNDDAGNSLDADGVIWLASGKGADQGTIRHEWFHGAISLMARLGILTEEDIALLRREFGAPLTEREFFNEEAGANTYDVWALDPTKGIPRSGAFPKIRNFFRSIAGPLGRGKRTVEDIFGDIKSGEALQRRIEQPTLLQPEPGTLAGTIPTAAEAARAQLSRPWYSGLSRAVSAVKQPRGTAPQMKATIGKMPGVTKQEMDESGLNDYLDLKAERGEKVTRGEIESYLAANGVKIVENIYGEQFTERTGIPDSSEDFLGNFDTRSSDIYTPRILGAERYGRGKRFDGVAPGPIEGYAELVLRTPVRVNEVALDKRADELLARHVAGEEIVFWDSGMEMPVDFYDTTPAALDLTPESPVTPELREQLRIFAGYELEDAATYIGEHWEDPNVVAWIRFSERQESVGGKQIMFVEEFQSDIHQEARDRGYEGDPPKPVKRRKFVRAEKRVPVGPVTQFTTPVQGLWHVFTADGDRMNLSASHDFTQSDVLHKAHEVEERLAVYAERNRDPVPALPFRGNAWKKLAIRRMIRWAADNGFDYLSWTTGKQQVDRYPGLGDKGKIGIAKFYDNEIPSLVRDVVRKLDPDVIIEEILIEQVIDTPQARTEWSLPVRAIEITPRIVEKVGGGVPTYARAQVKARAIENLDREYIKTMGRRIFRAMDVSENHLTADDDMKLEGIIKETADRAGWDVPAWHGTPAGFNEMIFKTKESDELGTHFSSIPEVAREFIGGPPTALPGEDRVMSATEWMNAAFEDGRLERKPGNVYRTYLNLKSPLRLRDIEDWGNMSRLDVEVNRATGFPQGPGGPGTGQFAEFLEEELLRLNYPAVRGVLTAPRGGLGMRKFLFNQALHNVFRDMGYDGIVYLNRREVVGTGEPGVTRERHARAVEADKDFAGQQVSDEEFHQAIPESTDSYIIFEPNQAKLADAIVRNDTGKVMLPSQRFKESKADMRAQLKKPPTDKQLVTRARQRIVADAKTYPEALRLELVIGKDGKPVIDETENEDGTITRKVRFKTKDYGLLRAPNRPKSHKRSVTKHADALVAEYNLYKGEAFIEVAREWYNSVRDFLQYNFGANMETLAQLFGATSPNTPAKDNFDQAMEALRKYAGGDYDAMLGRYDDYIQDVQRKLVDGTLEKEFGERQRAVIIERINRLQNDILHANEQINVLAAAIRVAGDPVHQKVLQIRRDRARWEKELVVKQKLKKDDLLDVKFDPADVVRKEINLFPESPRKSSGKKFGMNSRKVLQVLYGNWLTQTLGPKSPTFAGNQTGRTESATVDVWAARMLRRLMYSPYIKKWRILPGGEGSVQGGIDQEGETSGQYRYAQEVIAEAARKVGMLPQEFQAVMWFIEKEVWTKNGWATGVAAEKGNFIDYARQLTFARHTIGLTTAKGPVGEGDLDVAQFERNRESLKTVISKQKNVAAFRVNKSFGGFDSYVEHTFDTEFTVNVTAETADISAVVAEMLRIAEQSDQGTVFISEIVHEDHPNARPAFEVNFKRPLEVAQADEIRGILREHGIDGFTIAMNTKGKVLGLRFQYIPDYDSDLDLGDIEDFRDRSQQWSENAERAVEQIRGHGNVGVAFHRWVSTIVYERAEYGKTAQIYGTGTARVEEELGRRNRVRSGRAQIRAEAADQPGAVGRNVQEETPVLGGDASKERAALGAIEGGEGVPGRPDAATAEPLAPATRAKARAENARAQLERHRFTQRAAGEPVDPDQPNPVGINRAEREDLQGRPGAYYRPQTYRERREIQETMSDEGLLAGLRARTRDAVTGLVIESEDNFAVLDGLELLDRIRTRIDDPATAPEEVALLKEDFSAVMDEMDALGMQAAQLVRQFAESRAKNPATIVAVIAKSVESRGKVLSEASREKIQALADADVAARKALEVAEDRMAKTLSDEDIVAFDIAQHEADKALRAFSFGVADALPPRSMPDMIRQLQQGNLIVFRSHGINISSNTIRMFVDDMAHNAAVMADALIALIARRPRSIAFKTPSDRLEGASKGLKRGGRELVTGAEPGTGIHGELMVRGFHPLRAFVKLLSSGADIFRKKSKRKGLVPTLPSGRVSMDDWFKLMVEATIAIPAETQFRLLGLGDHPFRDSVYQDVVGQEASLRKLKGNERKVFMRNPDPATRRIALDRSLEAVYQKQGLVLQGVMGLFNAPRKTVVGDWIDALFVSPFVPFKTTPVNVASHALTVLYPPLAGARAFYHMSQASKYAKAARDTSNRYATENHRRLQADEYRKGMTMLSTAVFGMFINGIAATLVEMGLATGTPDDDDKLRSLDYANGRPTSINTSGLWRAMTGGDPTPRTAKYDATGELIEEGDVWRNAFLFGVLGIAAVIKANSARQEQKDIDAGLIGARDRSVLESEMNSVVEMLPELGSTMMDMTMLKGGYNVLEAMITGDYEMVSKDYFRVIGAIAMPGVLAEINRSRQVFIPDMKSNEEWHAIKNAFREKNVFIDWHAAFPFKRDGLGQKIERTPDGISPWMYHLFRADKPGWIKDDPLWQEIGKVYEESGHRAEAIPTIPSRAQVLEGTKVPLEPKEYERLQELIGDARREYFNDYNQYKYERFTPGQKAQKLSEMWDAGFKKGKLQFLKEVVIGKQTRSKDFLERFHQEAERQDERVPSVIRKALEAANRESTNRPRIPAGAL